MYLPVFTTGFHKRNGEPPGVHTKPMASPARMFTDSSGLLHQSIFSRMLCMPGATLNSLTSPRRIRPTFSPSIREPYTLSAGHATHPADGATELPRYSVPTHQPILLY